MKKPNNITSSILNKFSEMSGDRKIRIAMRLSEMTRAVSNIGAKATNTKKEQWKIANKTFSFQ